MGLFFLVLFVGGSLAFALRAWASYDEEPYKSSDGQKGEPDDIAPREIAFGAVTLVTAFLAELLRHSVRFSFLQAGAISVAILVVGRLVADRFFGKRHAETQDGPEGPSLHNT